MVGHHDCGEKFVPGAVVGEATGENDFACCGRQVPATEGRDSNEHRALVFLEVRELPPVAIFRFREQWARA